MKIFQNTEFAQNLAEGLIWSTLQSDFKIFGEKIIRYFQAYILILLWYTNFQAKPGYLPKDILSPRWIFEYELASPVEDIGSESAIKIDMYGTFGDVITEEIKIQKSEGKIVLEHSYRYRVQYNLEDVGLAVFKAWR